MRHAIAFAYDHVNSRVSVTALFPEPMCLRAVISYLDQKLPNGEFDIIVLSSKLSVLTIRLFQSTSSFNPLYTYTYIYNIIKGSDTTLVHKNIASRKHNICYEAKLLSIYGTPPTKPRKVLCYVGPKQVSVGA